MNLILLFYTHFSENFKETAIQVRMHLHASLTSFLYSITRYLNFYGVTQEWREKQS